MRHALTAMIVGLSLTTTALAEDTETTGKETVYYSNDGETQCDLEFWTKTKNKRNDHKVNFIGLSDERAHSGKKSMKLDATLDLNGHCYFKIPLGLEIEPGNDYYASGYVWVEKLKPAGQKMVGLGCDRVYHYGKNLAKSGSGCSAFDSVKAPTGEWVFMESPELGRQVRGAVASSGIPAKRLTLDKIFLGVSGGDFKNERVVVYLDDVKVSSQPSKSEKELETAVVKEFPALKERFAFGVYGTVGGFRPADASGAFHQTYPGPLWRTIPEYKRHYFNTIIGEGGRYYADTPAEKYETLEKTLKIFEANNLFDVPIVYYGNYYKPDMPEETIKNAIRTYVPRFKNHSSLLAWYVIDEPHDTPEALADYLRSKKWIAEVDDEHPVTTGANKYLSLFEKHKPISIFDRYPMRNTFPQNPWHIAELTAVIEKDAHGPVWYITQACGTLCGEYVRPSPAALRLMCYASVANGAKGIFFFCWRSRPSWIRVSTTGLIGPFEEPTALSEEAKDLGRILTSSGHVLMNAEIEKTAAVRFDTHQIQTAFENTRDALAVGVWKDNASDARYLVAYNNDLTWDQDAPLLIDADLADGKGLYDLYELKRLPMKKDDDIVRTQVKLRPGDGVILALATEKEYEAMKKVILRRRFENEREIVKYDLYRAWLSKLAGDEEIDAFKNAGTLDDLKTFRTRLDSKTAENALYGDVQDNLAACQKILANVHAIIEAKITSQESLAPYPSIYVEREFKSANPEVKAYLDACQRLGGVYFFHRDMLDQGAFRQIAADVALLLVEAERFQLDMKRTFVWKLKKPTLELNENRMSILEKRIDYLKTLPAPAWPDPEAMLAAEPTTRTYK